MPRGGRTLPHPRNDRDQDEPTMRVVKHTFSLFKRDPVLSNIDSGFGDVPLKMPHYIIII